MALLILFLIPGSAGLACFFIRHDPARRALLVAAAFAHLAYTAALWFHPPDTAPDAWFLLDLPGHLFLGIASGLFFIASIHAAAGLAREKKAARRNPGEALPFPDAPEAVFTGCLLLFQGTMTLVCLSQHLGMLWVAIEATTLASAPLIYYHRHRRSLEATWKYLLICSVGIALALLGTFFLAIAGAGPGEEPSSLVLGSLIERGPGLEPQWLKAAFLFLLVGYGTKMGLAPLHTWKPDAYSEAPSVVAALLAGALSNCAFLGVLRAVQICHAAGLAELAQELLTAFGLLSMAVAAVFMIRQQDFKRMLAYSSVEHMGILALGVGLGGAAVQGALYHALTHSLSKALLFLTAGNIVARYGTKSSVEVTGLLKAAPISGVLWMLGFLAICGTPPFGPFLSEFMIFKAAIDGGRTGVAIAYLVFLAVIFAGMASAVLHMALGAPTGPARGLNRPEPLLSVLPPAALAGIVLVLGLHVPPVLWGAMGAAARTMGGP